MNTPFIALEYSIFKDVTRGSEVSVKKTQVTFNIFTMESWMSSIEEYQIDLIFSTEKVPGH